MTSRPRMMAASPMNRRNFGGWLAMVSSMRGIFSAKRKYGIPSNTSASPTAARSRVQSIFMKTTYPGARRMSTPERAQLGDMIE